MLHDDERGCCKYVVPVLANARGKERRESETKSEIFEAAGVSLNIRSHSAFKSRPPRIEY